jgi:hypothetical protein
MEGLCQTYFWKRHHMWPPVPCTNYTICGESLFYVETLVFSILSIGCYSPSILLIYRLYYQAAYPWTLTEKHFEYNFIAITKCRFTNVSFSSGKWTLEKVNGIIYHYFSTMSSLISSAIYVCKNNCSPCWTSVFQLKYIFIKIGQSKIDKGFILKEDIQLTLIVSNSVDSNFRLSRIFIEVPNFVVYKYI